MTRISRDQKLIASAILESFRSTCCRAQVGAVIARNGRVISTGYVGAPSGIPHCSPEICNTSQPCTRTTHAEAGAIATAAKYGIALDGTELFCTHAPCKSCSDLIINAGIIRVVYLTPYRIQEGLEQLLKVGIEVTHWIGPTPTITWR